MTQAISRALISVSDKTGIVDFARELTQMGIEVLSTGGTARMLMEEKIGVIEVADYTGFPEMLDGRVKTLHPKIHGGILGRRDNPDDIAKMQEHGIDGIDLVCVNLYPFAATVAKQGCTVEDAIENIDIGGPTMVRAAAKNWKYVAILTDAADYQAVIDEIKATGGLSDKTRFNLARKAFSHTAQYDGMISNYLTSLDDEKLSGEPQLNDFPQQFNQSWIKVQDLRYGENPHQKAAFYRDIYPVSGSLSNYTQKQGKELSYNNIADADAAWEAVKAFDMPACVIVKHANPCGVAQAADTLTAYRLAFATDTTSAFGGIIAFNREVDKATAEQICANQFMEVLMAPSFTEDALTVVSAKKNVRVLEVPLYEGANRFELKRVGGGLLLQTPDKHILQKDAVKVVSKRQPTEQEWHDLFFLWKVAQFVKSNAVVFGKNGQTYGIGAGQMSRVDSTRIAARKAGEAKLDLNGACAASDAFFPFRDGVDVIAEQGIKAIIHPGGSIRDEEVFAAADEHGIAMVLTGVRHFRH